MLERIRRLPGDTLSQRAYKRDFRANQEHIEDVFWKLERRQTFQELGEPSWEAMLEGRWHEALALQDGWRPYMVKNFQRLSKIGFDHHRRLRVIEWPIAPYLQWELHFLKMQTEYGGSIRILDAAKLGDLEADGPLPEVVILGAGVLYEIIYTVAGVPNGGRRLTDRAVIDACREEMAALWELGEDLLPFFEREIAPLPPPPAAR